MGPATDDPAVLKDMVTAGMRVARINCSHGTPQEHADTVVRVRAVARETGVPVSVLYDLCGPKIRTGTMAETLLFKSGEEFTLTSRVDLGPNEAPLGFPELPQHVHPGQRILIDDGLLEAEVLSVSGTDILCRALNDGPLGSHKGINLPGATLPIPAVTEKDIEDLRFGLQVGIDWVAMSFVRSAGDIQPLKEIMDELKIHRPIIAKIEKFEAIANLDEILVAYDGVMVARGDLGVEVSLEEIPMLQKVIIRKANHAGKPVITATQMLDSMIRNPRPTRAEVTDVANAILDGTDAVMLSGETSVGKYPVETVRTMAAIANSAETMLPEEPMPAHMAPEYDTPTGALAVAAVDISRHLQAAAIIAATVSGNTARLVSKSRPHQPIVGLTASPDTFTQLPLFWGVTPFLVTTSENDDDLLDKGVRAAVRAGIVKNDDLIVIVAISTQPVGVVTRTSNILRIANVRQKAISKI